MRQYSNMTRLTLLVIAIMVGSLLPTIVNAEIEPNDTIAQALSLSTGYTNAIIEASISPAADVDFYKFAANAGYTYVIETFNIPNATGYAYPLGIKVLNSGENELVADESGVNGTGNVDARVIFKPQTSGTYFIRVASTQSWTGIYSLRVLPKYDEPGAAWDAANDTEPNDVAELAYNLEIGISQAQTHQIADNSVYETNASDVDFYRFTASAGRTYVIETFNIPNAAGYAYPLGIKVLNSNGVELVADERGENGTGNVDARVIFKPQTSGTYFIRVASTQSWTGIYSLRVLPKYDEPGAAWDADGEPNDTLELSVALDIGAGHAQTHQLADVSNFESNRADQDVYRFNAIIGQRYVIETFDVPDSGTYASFRSGILLFDALGNQIADDSDSRGDTGRVDARVTYQVPASGTYFVRVISSRGWIGPYSVRVCENSCTFGVYLPLLRR